MSAFAKPPNARVSNSTETNVPSNSNVTLSFNTVLWNFGGVYNAAIPTRLTAPLAGTYEIGANVCWAANPTGHRSVKLVLNGTTIIGIVTGPVNDSPGPPCQLLTSVFRLAAKDYVEVVVVQHNDTFADLTTYVDESFTPQFWMIRLR
jgi:hypothetical protein